MFKITKVDGKTVAVGKVKVGDAEHEVSIPLDGIEGIYTAEQVRETFIPKKEFSKRVERMVGTKMAEALQDEEFKANAMKTWNVAPVGEAANAPQGDALVRLQETWTSTHLAPVKTQLTAAQQEVESLRGRDLQQQVLLHGQAAGIAKTFLEAPRPGATPPIVNMLSGYFGYDAETRSWLVKDGEGFALSATPTADKTYQDVAEFVSDFAAKNPALVDQTRQRGPGAGQAGKGAQEAPADRVARLESEGKFAEASAIKAEMLQQAR